MVRLFRAGKAAYVACTGGNCWRLEKMKTKIAPGLALGLALAAALSTSAFAAPKHHAAVETDSSSSYGQSTERYYSPRSDVVTFGNRVIGQDPDLNIRSQMEHDPVPSEN
jgi:hypothetical protein